MNFDDYEQLPTPSVTTNMIAGAAAGVLEHCVMYPMDSIKTRMQSLSPVSSGQTLVSTFSNMVRHEGIGRPFRGVGAVVAGAGPAHAFYFASYEKTKEIMSNLFPDRNNFNYIVSAVTATFIHDAISNPTEVIKQRLQMYNASYRTIFQCATGVYRTEGFRAFYRSYVTQLCMNVPHQAIHFTTYEFFQNKLNSERKYNPIAHVISGGAAGGLAAACTTPLDVMKTLLNTQETGVGLTKGMKEAVVQILRMAGPLGFFKGLGARVLYSMPATAICWSTYEFFKFMLSKQTREDYRSSITHQQSLKPISYELATKTTEKKRSPVQDEQQPIKTNVNLRYVLPKTNVITSDIIADGTTSLHHTSADNTTTSTYLPPPRELPSVSGAGIYSAYSLNSAHSEEMFDPNGRGCNT